MTSTQADQSGASCDACERDDALSSHENAAGLAQIDYRIGGYGRFVSRMRGWISRQVVPPDDAMSLLRPLAALTSRAPDDPALALMDAWACVLDVLTFYAERIANEGFLRTATERQSVLRLASAIGYELAPGLAASASLAFTLLDSDKAPSEVTLTSGLQVQSVPGPGERPQTFETVEVIVARPEWNAMQPVHREPHVLEVADREFYLSGLATGVRTGDRLLVIGAERLTWEEPSEVWELRTVVELAADRAAQVTWVRMDRGLGWSGGDVYLGAVPEQPRIFAFSQRANVFGHSAPDPRMFGEQMKQQLVAAGMLEEEQDQVQWKDFTVSEPTPGSELPPIRIVEDPVQPVIHLVGEIKEIVPGSLIVLSGAGLDAVYEVESAESSSRTDFSLALKTTRLTLDTSSRLNEFDPRSVCVYAASRELAQAPQPIVEPLSGDELVLDEALELFEPGRTLLIQGALYGTSAEAEAQVEHAVVSAASLEERYGALRTVLQLESRLVQAFDRARTVVLGNVARATHGKTVANEVLGSGNGSKPFQSFTLRQQPLTYVASPNGGIESSLSVRVGGVAWASEPTAFGLGPDAAAYVARVDDAGKTSVTFGDGTTGARLPTGRENVTASYRVGLGSAGLVAKDKLTVLKTRPQGVRAVTNPLAASGAEDAETLADARLNAPLTVLTLDRLVSLRDYEDYARAYPGIGKAQAVRLWDGRRFWVHVTLATTAGVPLLPYDPLYQSFTLAIDARRDPVQRVMFATFSLRTFKLRATLQIDAAYVAADVIAAVADVMRAAFSFAKRNFGQAVTGSEILQLAHTIAGVCAMDLDALWFADAETGLTGETPASWWLPASGASYGTAGVANAELLLIATTEDAVTLEAAP